MSNSGGFKPLSKNDVAEVLGVSVRTLENWVNDGTLPAPAKLGARCYWHPRTFYAWLDRRLMDGAPEDAAIQGTQGTQATTAADTAPTALAAESPKSDAGSQQHALKVRASRAAPSSAVERMDARAKAFLDRLLRS